MSEREYTADESLRRLLNPLDRDLPAPDDHALAAIRARARDEFAKTHARQRIAGGTDASGPASNPHRATAQPTTFKRTVQRDVRSVIVKSILMTLATAATIGGLYFLDIVPSVTHEPQQRVTTEPETEADGMPLAQVLHELADAKTVRLVRTDEDAAEKQQILMAKGGLLRVDRPNSVIVGRRDRLWESNSVTTPTQRSVSPYYDTELEGINVLALLDIQDARSLRTALSLRPQVRDDRTTADSSVYRLAMLTDSQGDQWNVDVVTDRGSGRLKAIDARCGQRRRHIELVAMNEPLDEEKFVIDGGLSDDGRAGKVTDVQGVVLLRPAGAARGTPVSISMLLRPGDVLQTDVRGANAATLQLGPGREAVVGPGTQLEIVSADHVRLVEGELSLQVSDETSLQLEGADGQMRQVAGSHVYRQNRGREPLVELSLRPAWLQGYEGESVSDALGSLVAKIDGRDVPLTVGFHRVNVEIRDQIARTVIEESFVNNTGRRLEGVFYFPLPADASIAGFGMWIGDTLVEADIVEKQRAREIYETILREKRDPGLLEWAGGNLFKARVFPIEPHAEKKIKISYTQVLPLEGNSYRYSYALASDFLREHPLRELDIIVQVVSSVPLTSVGSPSHPTIDHQTTNAAELRYSAQDYSPIRDFEVQVEVNRPATAIKLIPHRRGDDGYFMLQLMPPTEEAAGWMRDVVGDSGPLALTLLCDTSASMDANARRKQAELVAALLQSLGANDRFRLAACDVDCVWFEGDAQPHDTTATPSARSWLEARRSLGWSNLKRTFEKVASAVPAGERVIYVGDGIDVAIESDPAAFAQFISQLKLNDHVTLHAVSVSSSYEALAMQAIASRGGGAVLQVNDSNSPADVARTILSEAVRPAIRDLHVQFEGLPTARVYPEQLPNLVVGKQQILLGRYLPAGATKDGQVVVSGMQNGKRVQFRAPISLVDDEQGNSFIPRLWARMHLDHLLQRGQSSTVRDDVIALSEEYHIITPYTSLLVLETDEDRERFKVQRRFQMRDGEKFFAEGRDLATYQLRQQQMKIAGAWRLGLRRTVLQQLQGLGRDIVPDVPQPIYLGTVVRELSSGPWGGTDWYAPSDLAPRSGGLARGYGGYGDPGGYGGYRTYGNNFSQMGEELQMMVTPRVITNTWESGGVDFESYSDSKGTVVNGRFENFDADLFATKGQPVAGAVYNRGEQVSHESGFSFFAGFAGRSQQQSYGFGLDGTLTLVSGEPESRLSGLYDMPLGSRRPVSTEYFLGQERYRGRGIVADRLPPGYPPSLINEIFALPGHPIVPGAKKPDTWTGHALELANGLLRREKLRQLTGTLRIDRETQSYDNRRNRVTSVSTRTDLVSKDSWVTRSTDGLLHTIVEWCDGENRGAYSEAYLLGASRAARRGDLGFDRLGLSDYSLTSLAETYREYTPEITRVDDRHSVLVLRHVNAPGYEIRFEIDTQRNVVLATEVRQEGKLQSRTQFSEFVEVESQWWATRTETFDRDLKRISSTTFHIKALSDQETTAAKQELLSRRALALTVHLPLPKVSDAKQAIARATEVTPEDHLSLVLYYAASQRWQQVHAQLEAFASAANKDRNSPYEGLRWLTAAVEQVGRRQEELRIRLLAEAEALSRSQDEQRYRLAQHVWQLCEQVLSVNERLEILDRLRPVYQQQPDWLQADKTWKLHRAQNLVSAGHSDDASVVWSQLQREYPDDLDTQLQCAQHWINSQDLARAYELFQSLLDDRQTWNVSERDRVREAWTRQLRGNWQYRDIVEHAGPWLADDAEAKWLCEIYLSSLVRVGDVEKASETVTEWLKLARRPTDDRTAAETARLTSAIEFARGRSSEFNSDRIEPHWYQPLYDATQQLLDRQVPDWSMLSVILNENRLRGNAEFDELHKQFFQKLVQEADHLSLVAIDNYVRWVDQSRVTTATQDWQQVIDKVRQRWQQTADPLQRHSVGQRLERILAAHADVESRLVFLREELAVGPDDYRSGYRTELFQLLVDQPWSAEYEDEALHLVGLRVPNEDEANYLVRCVFDLRKLTDAMVQKRFEQAMKELPEQEKLTRNELRDARWQRMNEAKKGVAARWQNEMPGMEEPLRRWTQTEVLALHVQLEQELDDVAAMGWELVGAKPLASPIQADDKLLEDRPDEVSEERDDEDAERIQFTRDQLAYLLQQRCLWMLTNLAARRTGTDELRQKLEDFFVAGQAMADERDAWRQWQLRLLISLDRVDKLHAVLQDWVKDDGPGQYTWREMLAKLLAEQGKVEDAIVQLEEVRDADELSAADYSVLANWYLTVDRREDYDRARVVAYSMMQEWELRNLLQQYRGRWEQRGDSRSVPVEFDESMLFVLRALMSKASSPHYYVDEMASLYRACRDFRLMESIPDLVIGHSAQQVYPLLSQLRETALTELHEEATVDQLVERIEVIRTGASWREELTEVDQRALDLLEALVESRAADLLNQPGFHAARASAAMQRAFDRQWANGEPVHAAEFLRRLGRINDPAMSVKQLEQLAVLHARAQDRSIDRLRIAHSLAVTLWSYDRYEESIDRLVSDLDAYCVPFEGRVPLQARDAFDSLVTTLNNRGRFAESERRLRRQLDMAQSNATRSWLKQKLYETYLLALQRDGRVSVGSGLALYNSTRQQMLRDISAAENSNVSSFVGQLMQLFETAHRQKLRGAEQDLRSFAFGTFNEFGDQQPVQYHNLATVAYGPVERILGKRTGLAFLIQRIEGQPEWLTLDNQDGWNHHAWRLSELRRELGASMGDLEPRLLAIVKSELQRDLERGRRRNYVLYGGGSNEFWAEKRADFLRVAQEVAEARKDSVQSLVYIADYIGGQLNEDALAIDLLQAAKVRFDWNESLLNKLAELLERSNRHGEAIVVLQELVEHNPGQVDFRARLQLALSLAKRRDEALEELRKSDVYFRKEAWSEHVANRLAEASLDCEFFPQAIVYYSDAIRQHKESQRNDVRNDNVLATYYRQQALALAGVDRTSDAVEAIMAGLLCISENSGQRQGMHETLTRVLRSAKNLADYVAALDKQSQETGMDNPVARRALGKVLQERERYAEALEQLRLAIQLQPADAATIKQLIECLDAAGDSNGALNATYQLLEVDRRTLENFRDAARRLSRNPQQWERMVTSMVEMMPAETESHTMLAEIRQEQGRWDDAIAHWQRVAELRELEPTGLLKLAEALIHQQQWQQANEVLLQLTRKQWPSRFDNVPAQVDQLRQVMP